MTKSLYAAALAFPLLMGLSATASAESMTNSSSPDAGHRFGVGVAFEGDTGLSLYADTTPGHFVQGTLAWGEGSSFAGTADYAFAYPGAITGTSAVTPYWGVGAVVLRPDHNFWSTHDEPLGRTTTDAGLRIPLGINVVIPKTPVQLGAEIAPTVILTAPTYSYLQGDVVARVLF